jgi:hypothetical protein
METKKLFSCDRERHQNFKGKLQESVKKRKEEKD